MPRLVVVAAVLAGAMLAHAGARRTVWMPPDAGGTRPELGLFPTSEAARACTEALAQAGKQPGGAAGVPAPGPGAPPGLRGEAASGPDAVRAACAGLVGLKHVTTVELLPPPDACGAGLAKVRVLDGTYRGRIGCVRSDGLRVR